MSLARVSPSTILLPSLSQSKHLPQSLPEIPNRCSSCRLSWDNQSSQALLLLCDCGGKYLCIDCQERKNVGRV